MRREASSDVTYVIHHPRGWTRIVEFSAIRGWRPGDDDDIASGLREDDPGASFQFSHMKVLR